MKSPEFAESANITINEFVLTHLGFEIVVKESGVTEEVATSLAKIAVKIRNLTDRGLPEGASTRLLVYAGRLIAAGVSPKDACNSAFAQTLSDDPDLQLAIQQLTTDFFL